MSPGLPLNSTVRSPATSAGANVAAWYTAAATGSGTSATSCASCPAACRSRRVRTAPQSAGCVTTRSSTSASPATRRASDTARASTACTTETTLNTDAPSSNSPSSMRRFGFGSKRDGSTAACRSASWPTNSVPSGAA